MPNCAARNDLTRSGKVDRKCGAASGHLVEELNSNSSAGVRWLTGQSPASDYSSHPHSGQSGHESSPSQPQSPLQPHSEQRIVTVSSSCTKTATPISGASTCSAIMSMFTFCSLPTCNYSFGQELSEQLFRDHTPVRVGSESVAARLNRVLRVATTRAMVLCHAAHTPWVQCVCLQPEVLQP